MSQPKPNDPVQFVIYDRATSAIVGSGTVRRKDVALQPVPAGCRLVEGIEADWEKDHIEETAEGCRRAAGRRFSTPEHAAAFQAFQAARENRRSSRGG